MILEIQSNTITGSEPTNMTDAVIYFRSEQSAGEEDSLIQSLLIQAREGLETMCNLSLVSRDMVLYLDEYVGYLPLGPVDSSTLIVAEGEAEFKGRNYPYCNGSTAATVEYSCIPYDSQDLINAIYELASYWYFRGGNDGSIPAKIKPVIKRYTRNLFA
jgi:hypothetical protein